LATWIPRKILELSVTTWIPRKVLGLSTLRCVRELGKDRGPSVASSFGTREHSSMRDRDRRHRLDTPESETPTPESQGDGGDGGDGEDTSARDDMPAGAQDRASNAESDGGDPVQSDMRQTQDDATQQLSEQRDK